VEKRGGERGEEEQEKEDEEEGKPNAETLKC